MYRIRDAQPADLPFVLDGWRRASEDFALQNGYCVRFQARELTPVGLVERCQVAIACDPDDDDQLYGFVCWERRPELVVHYLYVKADFRGFGVGRALWKRANPDGEPVIATSAGWCFQQLCDRYRLSYWPFIRAKESA